MASYSDTHKRFLKKWILLQNNDNKIAISKYKNRKAAKSGKASALSTLGHMYAGGVEVAQDYVQAYNYFAKASTRNCPGAFFGLGYLHMNGLGVSKNYHTAVKYFLNTVDAYN